MITSLVRKVGLLLVVIVVAILFLKYPAEFADFFKWLGRTVGSWFQSIEEFADSL